MAGHCIISDLHSRKTNQKLLREPALKPWKCLGSWQVQMPKTREAACLQSSSCSTSFGGGRSGCSVTGSRLDTTSRGSKQRQSPRSHIISLGWFGARRCAHGIPRLVNSCGSLRKPNVSAWQHGWAHSCASLCIFPARLHWAHDDNTSHCPRDRRAAWKWLAEGPNSDTSLLIAFRACRLSIVAVQIVQIFQINVNCYTNTMIPWAF